MKASKETILACLLKGKSPEWERIGDRVYKGNRIMFSVENYDSEYKGRQSMIWMEMRTGFATHREIGESISNLPESDWVVVKGYFDGTTWKLASECI